jgi:predicted transposase YdaD
LKEGTEEWILVHVEVQGYTDKNFPKRMFQYYTRIFDKYDQPITAFAIFADNNKSYHPKRYLSKVLGTRVSYSFNTFKIKQQDSAVLAASSNPFAMVVLSAKLTLARKKLKDQQLFDSARDVLKLLLTKKMPKAKIRRVMDFLHYYIHFENHEMLTKFEKEIAILTERSKAMGIEELLLDLAEKKGIEKGRKENEKGIEQKVREITINSLKNGMDINLIANITGLSISEVEKIAREANLSYAPAK